MSAKGFVASQYGHVVNLLPPASYSATQTSQVVNMKGWAHATIIVLVGSAGTPPTITVESSDNGSAENTTNIAFKLAKGETAYNSANGDVLAALASVASTGFQPAATNNIYEVIEVDAAQLASGQPYFRVVFTSPTSCFLACIVVLSAGRFEHDKSETVLA